jgi:hypothetical protein
MKNSEIHNGLERCEIRNFLAKSLIDATVRSNNNRPQNVPYDEKRGLECLILNAELQIEYWKRYVEIHKQIQAIEQLIYLSNWQEFDVSDETGKDNPGGWMSFIGTKEEYNNLLIQIKNEK